MTLSGIVSISRLSPLLYSSSPFSSLPSPMLVFARSPSCALLRFVQPFASDAGLLENYLKTILLRLLHTGETSLIEVREISTVSSLR